LAKLQLVKPGAFLGHNVVVTETDGVSWLKALARRTLVSRKVRQSGKANEN